METLLFKLMNKTNTLGAIPQTSFSFNNYLNVSTPKKICHQKCPFGMEVE